MDAFILPTPMESHQYLESSHNDLLIFLEGVPLEMRLRMWMSHNQIFM